MQTKLYAFLVLAMAGSLCICNGTPQAEEDYVYRPTHETEDDEDYTTGMPTTIADETDEEPETPAPTGPCPLGTVNADEPCRHRCTYTDGHSVYIKKTNGTPCGTTLILRNVCCNGNCNLNCNLPILG